MTNKISKKRKEEELKIWNKGLTKETDERIKKQAKTFKTKYREGKYKQRTGSNNPNYRCQKNKMCLNCKKPMTLTPTKEKYRKFCSPSCSGLHRKNKTYKEIYGTKKAIQLKKQRSKTRLKLFVDGKLNHKLENHPNWQNGISKEAYGLNFTRERKEEIKKRDNYTCQLCGDFIPKFISQRTHLTIHHIDYNKKNNNPDNLITLCNLCNLSANSTRPQWTNHFQNIMLTK